MTRGLASQLALGIFCTHASGFSPFAGMEELRPQRLHDFCNGEPFGLRWCEHSISRTLEDGGDVHLSWRMRADPDRILSLDTEAEHGVQLVKCSPDELDLRLPESHMRQLTPGGLIVGSREVHGCPHLHERHLYHRVREVRRGESEQGGSQRVRLVTEELPSFAHAVHSLSFSFSYMPVEARDHVEFPEMRTDFGLNREFLQRKQQQGRRLLSPFSLVKSLKKIEGVSTEDGGFRHGGQSTGSISTKNGLLNFMPKQVSNFGWNWNFSMNTTESPNYEITIPGARGIFKVRKPFVRVHSGIFLNFTSEFSGLTVAPFVRWQAGMNGHGRVEGRFMGVLNTTAAAGVNPFEKFNLPMLQKLQQPQWFQKVNFATGSMPVSFEPGFSFSAKMYHKGAFHGAVCFGIKTHGTMAPMLTFDSKLGFDTYLNGTLLDTQVIPPLWMIFTKRFELGVMLMPSLLMRGDFAGLEKATVALEMRPYVNLTITRSGESSYEDDATRALTVYPYRVMGISDVQFKTKYKVKIEAFGQTIQTTPEMNWGQVNFHDHVSTFHVAEVPEEGVIQEPITVSLYVVDESTAVPTEKLLGEGQVQCTSLLNGGCHPSPPIAHIKQGLTEIAAVELAILWQDTPQPFFASKIRGVGISFPQVVLRQDALAGSFPSAQTGEKLTMHLVHEGRTYTVPIQGDPSSQEVPLRGDTVIEFGPAFLETWLPCSPAAGSKCQSPRLELYYGSKQVAVAKVPQIEWTSQTAMQGTSGGFVMSSHTMNVPCSVALYAPGSETTTIAVVTMNAKVMSPASASLVFQPTWAAKVPLATAQSFVWMVSSVDTNADYTFTLSPLKLVTVPLASMEKYVTYRKVGNKVLVPMANATESFTIRCGAVAMAGMSADEAPCSFSHNFQVYLGFSVGDQVVMRIQWSKDGLTHEMYSPPFEIVPKETARRLREASPAPIQEPAARRLFSKEGWSSRYDQHKSCQTKDLHFNVGAGFLFRGRVDNVGVPEGFPMIGGLDEAPALTTGFRRIAAIKPGSGDASSLLPASLCKGGLCKGFLPGCSKTFQNRTFPKIVFNHNRPFHYSQKTKGKFHGLMKTALAYAFSTLPEVVEILIKEFNESRSNRTEEHAGGATHPAQATTVRSTRAPAEQWPGAVTPQPPPATTAPPRQSDNGAALDRWWDLDARRLQEVEQRPQQLEGLADNQVELRFVQGLHFKLDRPLVEQMLLNDFFMEVEDDASEELGPLRITSFELDEGIVEQVEREEARLPALTQGLMPLLVLAAAGCTVARWASKGRRSSSEGAQVMMGCYTAPAE